MALEDVPAWAHRVRAEVDRFLDGFEERLGYQPDANGVKLSADEVDPGIVELPGDVRTFFSSVDEVSLPDVWNGYFLGPADITVRSFVEGDPRAVMVGTDEHRAIQIGSDGGGSYYVVDLDSGGSVLRVSEAVLDAGVLRGVVEHVGSDLNDFLEGLCDNISVARRGGVPTF